MTSSRWSLASRSTSSITNRRTLVSASQLSKHPNVTGRRARATRKPASPRGRSTSARLAASFASSSPVRSRCCDTWPRPATARRITTGSSSRQEPAQFGRRCGGRHRSSSRHSRKPVPRHHVDHQPRTPDGTIKLAVFDVRHRQSRQLEDGVRRSVAAAFRPYGAARVDGSGLTATRCNRRVSSRLPPTRMAVLAEAGNDLLAIETVPSRQGAVAVLEVLDAVEGRRRLGGGREFVCACAWRPGRLRSVVVIGSGRRTLPG